MSHDEVSAFSVLLVALSHLGVESSSFLDCRWHVLLPRGKPELLRETFNLWGEIADEIIKIPSDDNVQLTFLFFEGIPE
jgi:hypothetical protein